MRRARYRAQWVLPVSAPPVRDGALLIDEDGRIAAVGPDAAVPRPEDVDEVDLGSAALLPGFVNVHAHPELAALRNLLEDLPFVQWISTLRRVKLRAPLDEADLYTAALWQLAEAYAAGITTIAATEDSAASFDALLESGGRGVVYREVFGPAPEQCADAMRELSARVESMRVRESDLVRVGISPHAPYTVSDELFGATARYAAAEGLPVAVHIAESQEETDLVERGGGGFAEGLQRRGIATPVRARSPIDLLARTGVLERRPLLIHAVRIDTEDIRAIVDAGASVAHCPTANARLGHGIAPVAHLLAAGATVALGTDSVASNNRLDLLEEARTAQLMQRAAGHSHDALDPATLLRMATLDGARALGIEAECGSLERGKSADFAAVSLAGVHTRPVHDIQAALVLAARSSDVVLTVVRGRVLYHSCPAGLSQPGANNGTTGVLGNRAAHTTIDVPALRSRMDAIAERVAAARAAS
ncbi:MAG TPA: amidohydrolase family protein [Longimicrobiales bacterium]|nr:amidohydrolase family protein [Longimicrobiales bacterium]